MIVFFFFWEGEVVETCLHIYLRLFNENLFRYNKIVAVMFVYIMQNFGIASDHSFLF